MTGRASHADTTDRIAANQCDKKLEAAFAKNNVLLPDLNVRTAQMFLMYLGFTPGTIDGAMGPRTRSALELFQQNEGLPVNGHVNAVTVDRLRAKVGKANSAQAPHKLGVRTKAAGYI